MATGLGRVYASMVLIIIRRGIIPHGRGLDLRIIPIVWICGETLDTLLIFQELLTTLKIILLSVGEIHPWRWRSCSLELRRSLRRLDLLCEDWIGHAWRGE